MFSEPIFPVALIADDGVAEVHVSLNSIVRTVEEPEVPGLLLVDSSGRAFCLKVMVDQGWFDKLLTVIGTPARYKIVPFVGSVSSEKTDSAKLALSLNLTKPTDQA